MVRPLQKWLIDRGVTFQINTRVVDLEFHDGFDGYWVRRILCQGGGRKDIEVHEEDKVIVTLGSMVEGSSLGSMESAPENVGKSGSGGWSLWEKMARSAIINSDVRITSQSIFRNRNGCHSPRHSATPRSFGL